MKAKLINAILIKNGNAYSLKINGEYVAFVNEDFIGYATQEFRDNLIGILSLKNCKAIERGYDLDELAEEEYPTIGKRIKSIPTYNQEGFKTGLKRSLKGENSNRAILTNEKVLDMKNKYKSGSKIKDLHKEFEIKYTTCWHIIKGNGHSL